MEIFYLGLIIIFAFVLYLALAKKPKPFLAGGDVWKEVTLIDKKQISHDSHIFTFGLPSASEPLGLPIGGHIIFRAKIPTSKSPSGELIPRTYTPTSPYNEKGKIELPIKIYAKTQQFPEGGLMTQHLDSLKIGDKLEVSGPKGRLEYLGKGTFMLDKEEFKVNKLGLVAGGTGITPCFQLIQYIIDQENGAVGLSLIYANKTEEDILLLDKLEHYKRTGKLSVFYTLDYPPQGWKSGKGFVSSDMVKEHLGRPSETFVVHCGPPGMNAAVAKCVKDLGFLRSFKF